MLFTIKELFFDFMELAAALVELLVDRLIDCVYLVKLLGGFALRLPTFFTWIPNDVYYLIGGMLSIVILYKLVGREG